MTEPRCRLYLIAPTPLPDGFASILDDALQGGDAAALRIGAGGLDDASWLAAIETVRRRAQAQGLAVILEGRLELAARAACDGAHLDGELPAPGFRRALGDLQLGVACGFSRDLAMQAGEAGADYISFGPFTDDDPDGAELVAWWAELMEIPVVAEGGITLENAGALASAGADFLAVGDAVWGHPSGPRAAVRAFNDIIRAHAPAG